MKLFQTIKYLAELEFLNDQLKEKSTSVRDLNSIENPQKAYFIRTASILNQTSIIRK